MANRKSFECKLRGMVLCNDQKDIELFSKAFRLKAVLVKHLWPRVQNLPFLLCFKSSVDIMGTP